MVRSRSIGAVVAVASFHTWPYCMLNCMTLNVLMGLYDAIAGVYCKLLCNKQ